MIFANHYVIRDLLHTLESGDLEELGRVCDKYCGRYKNDSELVEVCDMLHKDLKETGDEAIKSMELRFNELLSIRRLETSGGTRLWFEDRRRM